MPVSMSRPASAVCRRPARLRLEALEDRSLPSVSTLGALPLNLTTASQSTSPQIVTQSSTPHVVSAAAQTANGALNGVTLTFDRAMNPSTLNTSDITLTGPNGPVALSVQSQNSTTFTVSFADQWTPGNYTLQISSAAKSSAGIALSPYQDTFSVAAPHVVSAAARTSGSSVSGMMLTFSSPMNAATLNSGDITLSAPNGPNGATTKSVAITVQAVAGTNNTSFLVSFPTQTTPGNYTLHVSSVAKSSASIALTAYTGTFTIANPAPTVVSAVAQTSGNGVNGMKVTFSAPMSAATLNTADITLTGPTSTGSKAVSITGVQAAAGTNNTTFLVSFALQTTPGTYTLHISSAAKSAASVALPAYTGTFTIANPAPSVVSAVAQTSGNGVNGMKVTFSAPMSAATLNTADITLTGPTSTGSKAVSITGVQAVAGTNNTTFLVSFALQTTPGTYTLHVSSAAESSFSVALPAYTGTFVVAPPVQPLAFPNGGQTAIAPGGVAVSLLNVAQNVTIQDLQVKLNITYPNTGNLEIYLQAPNGTDILLVKYAGSGANFTNTTFDDNGSEWALFAQAPFPGTYQPMVPLSSLNGASAAGTWKLWVENSGTSSGTINSWSLVVNP